jgi:thioredoxin 1
MLKKLTDASFASDVKSDKPILVDFWAAWCPPCVAMEPTMEKLAEEFDGKADIGKLNVDENPHTAMQFQVRSIPTLILFKNGEPVEELIGLRGKPELTALLEKHI